MASRTKLVLLVLFVGGALVAQKVVSARAGLITYLQGPAFVDGKRVILRSTRFPQMRNGETLSTSRGRAELLLAPGVVLRLSENAQVRMEDTDLADTQIALDRGDALIEVLQLAEGNRIHLRLAETVTELARPGLYRFGAAQRTLRVWGGEALVRLDPATTLAKRGMSVDLNAGLVVSRFDRKQTDPLHAWAARRSFDLFMGDPETREKQNHWQFAGAGYMENKNFGVEFRAFIRRRPASPTTAPWIPRPESR